MSMFINTGVVQSQCQDDNESFCICNGTAMSIICIAFGVGACLGSIGPSILQNSIHFIYVRLTDLLNLSTSKDDKVYYNFSNRPTVTKHLQNPPSNSTSKDMTQQDIDAWRVLQGSLEMFAKRVKLSSRKQGISNCNRDGKVVNYLSPEEVMRHLFKEASEKGTESSLNNASARSLCVGKADQPDGLQSLHESDRCQHMLELFSRIHEYSVDTSHPYFFNQLWGTLDPIALAAELIALCANTSVATFEIAPVFTMIEREVLEQLGHIIFGGKNDEAIESEHLDEEGEHMYDGQMQPGGSLSNLTALHVARHHFKATTQYLDSQQMQIETESSTDDEVGFSEEKKEPSHHDASSSIYQSSSPLSMEPTMVAFISSEAHYSFSKSMSVAGLGSENLVIVPTLPNGQMDVKQLDALMTKMENESFKYPYRIPFFVGLTAGSTVRGSFDDIEAVVRVCRKHEQRLDYLYQHQSQNLPSHQQSNSHGIRHKIWIHVDGAWGGPVIFSPRRNLQNLLKGVDQADSFTINLHKMLGAPQQTTAFVTRHRGILQSCNSTRAKYLFDYRKHGAKCDLGDASYQCGRRTDAIKFWALWKYYGSIGLGRKVEEKADALSKFANAVKEHESFMLACEPWPFNVNFFYLPKRIRQELKRLEIDTCQSNPVIPDHISNELASISVKLKLKLHESGRMLIPFQPLSNQKADCFRLVLAGNKSFDELDVSNVIDLMEEYGSDL